jgi:putative (di)nucleoside polyphosphate hydrolase
VVIVVANTSGQVLWARRVGQDAWQFPQGGIDEDESPHDAMYRELREEVGLKPDQVEVVASTSGWLHYRLPAHLVRRNSRPLCVGQKQKWFLLRMLADDDQVSFEYGAKPEFDHWRWVSYWYPLDKVIEFKQDVYRRAMAELCPLYTRLLRAAH